MAKPIQIACSAVHADYSGVIERLHVLLDDGRIYERYVRDGSEETWSPITGPWVAEARKEE